MIACRVASETDWESLAGIFTQIRERYSPWLDPQRTPPDDLRKQTEGETIYVAARETEVLGFISVWVPERFIHHLYVDVRHQRWGVGSWLIDHVLRQHGSPLRLKCVEANRQALQFYEKNGWQILDRAVGEEGPYCLMELKLAEPMK